MTIYRYDLAELEETAGALSALAGSFRDASSVQRAASDALGYPSLRDAVAEFTDNWENNRDKQVEAITGAGDMLGQICQNYRAFDSGAATELLKD
ncbi:MAG TPA: hypothetical protein VFR07_07400 [Mycobacteriales bacterium]|nr:hypothetical protein [Mycobacteriales bacterium]